MTRSVPIWTTVKETLVVCDVNTHQLNYPSDPAYSLDEWRRALRQAVEKAAALEDKLERAREAMPKKRHGVSLEGVGTVPNPG